MIHPILQAYLGPAARRLARRRLAWALAAAWGAAAILAGLLTLIPRVADWNPTWTFGVALATTFGLTLLAVRRERGRPPLWRKVAARIEAAHPELNGRLLTAVEQTATPQRGLNYLQTRVVFEACDHARNRDWRRAVPLTGQWLAHAAQLAALAALWLVVSQPDKKTPSAVAGASPPAHGVTVSPGDVTLERGQSLVVLARFGAPVPDSAELVWREAGGEERRLPMTRSLNDPLFGASVPEVTAPLTYRVDYPEGRSPEYTVTVFEYPRLVSADAALEYPTFTALPPRQIADTRRVSAVEGTRVTLELRLNKPVRAARLAPRDPTGETLVLRAASNQPLARLEAFPLLTSQIYDLRLEDTEGRTNKEPATFTFSALSNRLPELRLTAPRGDLRPSPLEEIAFAGTVWDDFGVLTYGLAWLRPGREPVWIELGRDVPGRERRAFAHLLRLEELDLRPDDLISWFVWAEDLGADGLPRRTVSDLFFGEVRPFEEIFREGEAEAAGPQQQAQTGSGEAGGPSGQLAELQKQIMTATWKLLQRRPAAAERERSSLAPVPVRTPAAGLNPPAPTPPADRWVLARPVFTQWHAAERGAPGRRSAAAPSGPSRDGMSPSLEDLEVILQAQARALEQAREAASRGADPRGEALWEAATQAMETALEKLQAAGKSPDALAEAFAAQQAAYQALLRLQEREYSVSRSRNRSGQQSGGSRQQQMQRQLDQLELTREENRYETESRAPAPDSPERREQLQTLNRLRELARRQQDLNERLRELQTALEEARTPAEREALRRELRRLQEQERQMLAEVDELQQRLDRSENPARLSDTRQQLEQTRREMQRAAEALDEGAVSRALAAGARAQDQLEQMRDQLRRASAGEFAEDLRQLRADARELTREQENLARELAALNDPARRTLSDAEARQDLLNRLGEQQQRLTNLLDRATTLSQQTEEAEPLVSRQLYDTLRRFHQEDGARLRQMRQELLERGQLTYTLDSRLQEAAERPAQGLELTAELLRQGLLRQADEAERRARGDLQTLQRGVEQAAEKVLGDDAEALRLARRELEDLAEQVAREIASAQPGADGASSPTGRDEGTPSEPAQARAPRAQPGEETAQAGEPTPSRREANPDGAARERTSAERQPGRSDSGSSGARTAQASAPSGDDRAANRRGSREAPAQGDQAARSAETTPRDAAIRQAGATERGPGGRGGAFPLDLEQLLGGPREGFEGPITGEDFAAWADRLREVEELVELPDLRSRLAAAREQARRMRQEYRRELKKPDWAVVRLEVLRPLVEVREMIAGELARREPRDQLVPVDRDPVPARFSELVRRYYEALGRAPSP